MATQTSTKPGLWSDPTVWTTAVPLSGDTVVVAVGHTVTFNVDQSGFAAGLAALTLNGTLQCSTSAGSYYLKMDGTSGHDITFGAAGQFLAGTAGTPLPLTVTCTIDLNGNSKINCASGPAGCLALYCTQPTYLGAVLNAGVSVGATSLPYTQAIRQSDLASVAANLATDAVWGAVASQVVRVDNINQARDSEARVLSAISSSALTLTAGLTNAKIAGAYVWLTWRNVRLINYNTSAGAVSGGTAAVLQCEIALGASGTAVISPSATVSGVIHGGTTAIGSTLSTVTGLITGCNVGLSGGTGHTVRGVISGASFAFNGVSASLLAAPALLTGSTFGANSSQSTVFTGAIRGCATGLSSSQSDLRGAALSGNAQDITFATPTRIVGYGATLGSSTQVANYATASATNSEQVAMWDIGGTTDAYKAWMYGGTVASDTGTLPGVTGITYTFKHAFERAGGPVYTDIPIRLVAGVNRITVYLRQDGTGRPEVPNAQLIVPGSDPFFGGAAVASVAMTDTANAWATLTLTYTSSRAQQALVRLRGAGSSGNFWGQIAVAGGGMAPIGSSFIKGVH